MRLSAGEIKQHVKHLAGWQSPSAMQRYVDVLGDHLGSEDYFNQAGLTFLREAWAAAQFGEKRGAELVRRIDDLPRPDIALQFPGGVTESFEVVEADEDRRTRGLEYKRAASGATPAVTDWPVEQWATAEDCLAAVRSKAEKKAQRASELLVLGTPYPPGTGLLILLNLATFGAHQDEIVAGFPLAVQPAREWFQSVWILWQGNVYQP